MMALSYADIVSTLENEFFLIKIRNQVENIHDPAELRTVVLALVELLQNQRTLFLDILSGEATTEEIPSAIDIMQPPEEEAA